MVNHRDLPLFSQESPGPSQARTEKPKALTVSELTQRIRGVMEPAFSQVWVQGEVSNCRPAASGHIYFSLKDSGASISAVNFKSGARKFELQDGLQVLCRGKLSIYPPRGGYQIIVEQVEPLGAGALQVAFEQLKAKLSAEGLFDSARKRKIPPFPRKLVVITSPSGAAIRDILNVLGRRAPHVGVLIVPAIVQGEEAPRQLIRAIEAANRHDLGEVILLARGGGSIEDLWCFNDEGLARTIAASRLPIISGVGHEIDFTISDFVADLRAATPSAAAELVTGHWADVARRVHEAGDRLRSSMARGLSVRRQLLTHVSARLVSPKDRLREQSQRLDELFLRLDRAIHVRMERRRATLDQWMGKLDALSPLRVLERGYSIVRETGPDGRVVRSATEVETGWELSLTFYDGQRTVRAT